MYQLEKLSIRKSVIYKLNLVENLEKYIEKWHYNTINGILPVKLPIQYLCTVYRGSTDSVDGLHP